MSFYSKFVLLILEFNICMKHSTEIPSNQSGELKLLFYIILLVLHILSTLTVQFSQKKKLLTFLSKESIHSTLFQNYGLHNT